MIDKTAIIGGARRFPLEHTLKRPAVKKIGIAVAIIAGLGGLATAGVGTSAFLGLLGGFGHPLAIGMIGGGSVGGLGMLSTAGFASKQKKERQKERLEETPQMRSEYARWTEILEKANC